MLSRNAEGLFWIGRHVERSDGTARILEVHLQLLLEEPWIAEDLVCRSLLEVMRGEVPGRTLGRQDVLAMLAVDRRHPASIAYSVGAALESARRARELVPSELWECLNTTRARMPRKVSNEKTHGFFGWVCERAALAVGIVESGASRDEAWRFFTLGRSLEQADMTARLLATRALPEAGGPSWTTILRSCGAHEPYLRTFPGVPMARNAAQFLLLDRLFPRSIVFSLSRAEQCLRELEQGTAQGGASARAERILGQIRGRLERRPITDILRDLPLHMDGVRHATNAASTAIAQSYFPASLTPTNAGEAG